MPGASLISHNAAKYAVNVQVILITFLSRCLSIKTLVCSFFECVFSNWFSFVCEGISLSFHATVCINRAERFDCRPLHEYFYCWARINFKYPVLFLKTPQIWRNELPLYPEIVVQVCGLTQFSRENSFSSIHTLVFVDNQ